MREHQGTLFTLGFFFLLGVAIALLAGCVQGRPAIWESPTGPDRRLNVTEYECQQKAWSEGQRPFVYAEGHPLYPSVYQFCMLRQGYRLKEQSSSRSR